MTGPQLTWIEARQIGVEGQGWADTAAPYDRLPARAESLVPAIIWQLSRTATGMCVHFRTNAYEIHARWKLRDQALGEANFNVASYSGLDLYGQDHGVWRWVNATPVLEGQSPELCIANGLDGGDREYCLYLPLRNPVLQLEVGIPSQSAFEAVPPRREKPLVFYGTSIVHGAFASHAGLVYPAILGRRLNRPVINLGFSGNARMDPELAPLLGELDAGVCILDPLPNMDAQLVGERAEPFIRTLRSSRPGMPIVLVEDFPRTNAWIKPEQKRAVVEKCRCYRAVYERLVAANVPGLHVIEGHALLGTDHEASIDGIHPGDLGFMRMADAIEPILKPLTRG